MKKPILILTILVTVSARAQPAANPPAPFSPTIRGLPASPLNPGLPASPPNSGLPGFNNTFAPFFTNQLGSNLISTDLGPVLASLQNDIQQALPLVGAFISNVEPGTFGAGPSAANTSTPPGAALRPTGNSSSLFSRDLSTLASRDVSTHFPIARATATPQTPASSHQTGALGFLPPTGVTNSAGLPPGFGAHFVINNVPAVGTPEEVFRQFVILEADMERMLPVLIALNGGSLTSPAGAFTNAPGTLNNPVITPSANPSFPTVTPTGR